VDFSLSDDQKGLQELARRILRERATPERLREIEAGPEKLDRELWAELARAGLLGAAIPEAFGGAGLSFLELCLLLEEVGRAVAPLPALATLVEGALPVARFGSEAQRRRLLPGVARGECLLAAALVEPGEPDPLAPHARASREGASWRLSGRKICVPHAPRAERLLVPARGEAGVGLFLLDPRASGVALARQETTAREPRFALDLAGAPLAEAEVLVPPSPAGAAALQWTVERAIAARAALQLGVCAEALRMTAAYTASREQFGRKLSTFQAVGQRAAGCYVDVECLRLTVQQAVWLLAEERPASEEVAIAKFWAGDAGHRVSFAAQHLHGGIGVDLDYPLHRYCLWAKQLELDLGSSAHQLEKLGRWIAAA
jgi:alkylation response protein AidB-like acyl-CoA dehydrogenase